MNRAAQKIRAWRKAQVPPLTQAAFGELYGLKGLSISRIERGERLPRLKVAIQLEADGIAVAADWHRPAIVAGDGRDGLAESEPHEAA